MNLEQLKKNDYIIFEAITGSHAYGTNLPTSDIDIRGIFRLPVQQHLSLLPVIPEISDEKQDIKYYELRKFIDLAKDCNPNIIELLFLGENLIKVKTPVMQHLLDHNHLFISKKAYHTHIGYAHSQIEKAKGQHKKVHNPQPEKCPTHEDFCFYIPYMKGRVLADPPARPITLAESGIDLTQYHCARVEQTANLYRLYYYGKESKGVFRGDHMLTPESIPLDDEVSKFSGLLLYNPDLYEKAKRDWHSYWDWKKNRNEQRWVDQEKGLINYDAKNMMHCCRLLMSGKNILITGKPIITFTGKDLQFLQDIRASKYKYEEIMKFVEDELESLKKLYETSQLSYSTNINKINKLYTELINM